MYTSSGDAAKLLGSHAAAVRIIVMIIMTVAPSY